MLIKEIKELEKLFSVFEKFPKKIPVWFIHTLF